MLRKLLAEAAYRLPRVRGKDRLFRGAIKMLARGDHFVVTRGGVNYAIEGQDWIDYLIISNDAGSPQVVDTLAQAADGRSGCFWDIGANIGTVALPLLQRCPNLTGVLFEPSPAVMGRLMRNLALNPDIAARCTVIPLALSDRTHWTEFYASSEPSNSGLGGLKLAENRQSIGFKVLAHRADELGDLVPPPDLAKIDVEGFELEVLTGMGELLSRHPTIVYEHSPYRFTDKGQPLDSINVFLEQRGYQVSSARHSEMNVEEYDDFIAVRASNEMSS